MHRVIALVVLASCTTYVAPLQGDPATGRSVVLHEDTVLLDDIASSVRVETDRLIVDTADGVEVGAVVVGQRGGGYLRRVTVVASSPEGVVLHTVAAGLRDALLEAHVQLEVPVGRRGTNRWDLDDVVLADTTVSGAAGNGHVRAALENTWVTFEPVLTVDIDMDADDDDASVHLGFILAASTDLVVETDGRLAHQAEALLFADAIPFSFAIGPVPVVGTADLSVHAGYDAWVAGAGEVGLHTEGRVEAGIEAGYRWGDWYGDYDATSDFVVEPWTAIDAGGEARVTVRGEVGATLYGSTSVHASVIPWMGAEICAVDAWRVDAGVEGEMGFDLAVLGWDVWSSDPISLGAVDVVVAESDVGACEG